MHSWLAEDVAAPLPAISLSQHEHLSCSAGMLTIYLTGGNIVFIILF